MASDPGPDIEVGYGALSGRCSEKGVLMGDLE
jgi:hypothetical protein